MRRNHSVAEQVRLAWDVAATFASDPSNVGGEARLVGTDKRGLVLGFGHERYIPTAIHELSYPEGRFDFWRLDDVRGDPRTTHRLIVALAEVATPHYQPEVD